jgi:hypothetical protein
MKRIAQLVLLAVVLMVISIPIQAQNPAVRMAPGPTKESVKVSLRNLAAATIAVGTVELQIFDQKTCKRLCATRLVLNKKIASCQNLDFEIRCSTQIPNAPGGYIYFLRVRNTANALLTEDWLFNP